MEVQDPKLKISVSQNPEFNIFAILKIFFLGQNPELEILSELGLQGVKKSYFLKSLTACDGNSRKTWETINEVTGRKSEKRN